MELQMPVVIGSLGAVCGGVVGLITGIPICGLLHMLNPNNVPSTRIVYNLGVCVGINGAVGCAIGATIALVTTLIAAESIGWVSKTLQAANIQKPLNIKKAIVWGACIGSAYGAIRTYCAISLAKILPVVLGSVKFAAFGSLAATIAAIAINIFGIIFGLVYALGHQKQSD